MANLIDTDRMREELAAFERVVSVVAEHVSLERWFFVSPYECPYRDRTACLMLVAWRHGRDFERENNKGNGR